MTDIDPKKILCQKKTTHNAQTKLLNKYTSANWRADIANDFQDSELWSKTLFYHPKFPASTPQAQKRITWTDGQNRLHNHVPLEMTTAAPQRIEIRVSDRMCVIFCVNIS